MARILLVDDEPGVREVVSRVLERAGHQVTVADDGTTALREIQQRPPDLLLTDLHRPGLDGFQLLQAVRQRSPPMKIIVFSGYGGSHLLDLARRLGAEVTLEKPLTSAHLRQALQQWVCRPMPSHGERARDVPSQFLAGRREGPIAERVGLVVRRAWRQYPLPWCMGLAEALTPLLEPLDQGAPITDELRTSCETIVKQWDRKIGGPR